MAVLQERSCCWEYPREEAADVWMRWSYVIVFPLIRS